MCDARDRALPQPIAAVVASVSDERSRCVVFSCATDADFARAMATANNYGRVEIDRYRKSGSVTVATNWNPQDIADYLSSL